MYLEDGREIYESDKYPGYYIDANTGDFCDEQGHYIGGNQDNGDKPGNGYHSPFHDVIVYVSKSGKHYYAKETKTATIPVRLSVAIRKNYTASRGYSAYRARQVNKLDKQRERRK